MKKVVLTFPTHDSLWSFKDKSKAINIRIEPKRNVMTGLFDPCEIEIAVNEFQAVGSSGDLFNPNSSNVERSKTKTASQRFIVRSALHRLFLFMKF
jgi:hypothetical protein